MQIRINKFSTLIFGPFLAFSGPGFPLYLLRRMPPQSPNGNKHNDAVNPLGFTQYYGKSRLPRPVTVTGLTASFVLYGWCIRGNYLFWSLIKDENRASLYKAMQVPLKKPPSLRVVFFPAALSFVAHVVAHNQRPKEVVPNKDRRAKFKY